MADYILSCCTCADLTAQRFKDLGVETIGFHYTLNGVEREDGRVEVRRELPRKRRIVPHLLKGVHMRHAPAW